MLKLADAPSPSDGESAQAHAHLHGALHAQRARGEISLSRGASGIRTLRESGSLKIRLPMGDPQAILINTAGGIAGGDAYRIALEAEAGGRLTVTTQAAERVYRTLGPRARIHATHRVGEGATLHWLPQETILFDGSGLERQMQVDMAESATFLGLETTILGRRESGETINGLSFRDSWTIRRGGRLIHAERLRLDAPLAQGKASLAGAGAFATLLLVAPEAERLADRCEAADGGESGISAWNGKLVIRLAAPDGFTIRKRLLRLLPLLLPLHDLPRAWLL